MAIIFNTKSLDEESLSYDEVTDRVNIIIHTTDVNSVAEVILDQDNLSSIRTEKDIFEGYTKIRAFSSNYDEGLGRFICFISLEPDESIHEKLIKRIKALEDAKVDIVEDVQALQKVNLATLIKDGLISDDKAAILSPIEKPTAGQISLDDLKEGIGKA